MPRQKLTPEEVAELKELLPENLHKWIEYELPEPPDDDEEDPPPRPQKVSPPTTGTPKPDDLLDLALSLGDED